ncbi:iron uptake system protein EfeO [Ammonicoccus fulvus]|uniref:Iron uptake system protein EfeO n=1 Tax=Ammonicoccus fulvus TaxID=3138240 RepID=A0ABZ3FQ04_9ACTN
MNRPHRLPLAVIATLLLATACTDNTSAPNAAGDPQKLTVAASDSACSLSAGEAPAGKLTFAVTNNGSKVNEFYVLGDDGLRIIGEVENIGPGLTRELVLSAQPGNYFTACKPGMVGDGIRAAFTVTGQSMPVSADDKALLDQANAQYQSYVKDQTDQLLAKTELFAEAYRTGQDDRARQLYPDARTNWERIETVAESFGDLDPRMDAREADLEEGQEWTGWHRMEKDLWPQRADNYTPLTPQERARYADQLVSDTRDLHTRTRDLTFTADVIGNGAKGLLDEVATGKVTGEEEYWSRTDLWDFQANVDGARVAWEGLRPLLQQKNPDLDRQIETDFGSLQELLDQHRVGTGFKTYDQLGDNEIRELSDAVNALSEPLSQLTAAVI